MRNELEMENQGYNRAPYAAKHFGTKFHDFCNAQSHDETSKQKAYTSKIAHWLRIVLYQKTTKK